MFKIEEVIFNFVINIQPGKFMIKEYWLRICYMNLVFMYYLLTGLCILVPIFVHQPYGHLFIIFVKYCPSIHVF